MIQSILFFALGFLCAGFLALMIAPALWRRAVSLTRRRIEASVPLTLNEIQADKDRLRAEFAMSTRRLEMTVQEFKDRATLQLLEVNRNRDDLKRLTAERDERSRTISELETRGAALRDELRRREEELSGANARLEEVSRSVEDRSREIDRMGKLFEEASYASSSRQIELVARESELEKVSGAMSDLRAARKEADRRTREAVAETRALQETMKIEKKRATDLDKKLAGLMATVADRDETLERRNKEFEHVRDEAKAAADAGHALQVQLAGENESRVKLEAEVADLTGQLARLVESAKGGDFEKAAETLRTERDRLEATLDPLRQENRRLKTELAARERAQSEDWNDEKQVSALLREQMNDLAAEVLHLTAMLDGPNSPVVKALDSGKPANANAAAPLSLADRVRALQKAASAG